MSAPTPDDPYADALSQALSTGKVVIEGAGVQAVVDFTGATPTAEHADTAEQDVTARGVYISSDTLKEWRADAEQRADRADSHIVFAARVVALINALEAPCGACHPCSHYAAETWRQAGGEIPHKVFVDEWREKAERTERAEAEAHDLAHEVDRVRERLWRLAARAGWRSGNPADNDATAELYIAAALKAGGADA